MSVRDDLQRIASKYTSSGGEQESCPTKKLPRLPSFEAYNERMTNELTGGVEDMGGESGPDAEMSPTEPEPVGDAPPELDMANNGLSNKYAQLMPRILNMVRSARDAQQLLAKLQNDIKLLTVMTDAMGKRMDRTRGGDVAGLAGMA